MNLSALLFGSCEVKQKPAEWTNAKPLTERLDHPDALATDGQFIYFINGGGTVAGQQAGNNNLMKMPIGGGTPTAIFKGESEIIPDADAIAQDENSIYLSANGLRRVPKAGSESQLLTRAFMASEIVADNDFVYWMPFTGEGMPPAPIFAVSKKGGKAIQLTDPRPTANGLCVDDEFVYWVQTDGLYRQSKKNSIPEKIYITPANEITSDLKMDSENFYFLQAKSKRNLMKLSKKGGAATLISKEPSQFWVGENDIIIMRYVGFTDTAIFKINKEGAGERKLDSGYVSDLIIHQNKVYVSDMVKIYELNL